MFDKEFYPTPKPLSEKLLKPFIEEINKRNTKSYNLLEPSAGKGDILEYIDDLKDSHWNNMKHYFNIYAIEINDELQMILRGKHYNVIFDDFLKWKPSVLVDLIVMNPPFSNGDEHLLKAIEVLEEGKGGDIACILNHETLENPYSKKRQLLLSKLSQYQTNVETIQNAFKNSERKTGVEIDIIHVHIPERDLFEIDFTEAEKEKEVIVNFEETDFTSGTLEQSSKTKTFVRCYENAKLAMIELLKAKRKAVFYMQPFLQTYTDCDKIISKAIEKRSVDAYNSFAQELKSLAWRVILNKIGIERLMTSSIREQFQRNINSQYLIDLTEENVYNLVKMLLFNGQNILKQSVVDVFDYFTKYHGKNRCHVEGWKTNSAWKVNKKVILPYAIKNESWYDHYRVDYSSRFTDVEKAMCYVLGRKYEDLDSYFMLQNQIEQVRIGDSSLHSSHFFDFRCYKKGTIHLYFKKEEEWALFNQTAVEEKFEIGGDFK